MNTQQKGDDEAYTIRSIKVKTADIAVFVWNIDIIYIEQIDKRQ